MRALAPILVLAATATLSACGSEESGGSGRVVAAAADEPRSADPRLASARAALAEGRLESAVTLAGQVGASAGVEGPLCRARARFLGGETIAALAAVEEARSLAPADSRVFATAAEFLALGRRGGDAEDELAAGLEVAGPTPDLSRARAVLHLTRPGQGARALALLEDALAADPDLPYTDWPLSQAHLLTGRLVLGTGDAVKALDHAEAALSHDPDLAEARELAADALATSGELVGAIAAYREAAAAGLDVTVPLADAHLRAGMFARLEAVALLNEVADSEDGRRDELKAAAGSAHRNAEEHYLAARALGLGELQLGSAADYLDERADEAHRAGVAAGLRGERGAAQAEQARALELDPDHEGALHELARMRFEDQDYPGAALLFGELVALEATADGEGASHLNQARALVLSGRSERAREVLDAYLNAWPEGTWVQDTRDMLARLP